MGFFFGDRMAGRRQITKDEWLVIKEQYETGSYSLRTLSDLHGIPVSTIATKARRDSWSRKYQEVVEKRASELIDQEVGEAVKNLPDIGIECSASQRREIEVAAEIRKQVLLGQQNQLATLQANIGELLKKVSGAINGKVEGEEVSIVRKGIVVGKTKSYDFLGPNESLSDAVNKLAQAASKAIPLARQAFRIDEDDGKKDPIADLIDDIKGRQGLIKDNAGDLSNTDS